MARRPVNHQVVAALIGLRSRRRVTDRARNRGERKGLHSGRRAGRLGDEIAAIDAGPHGSSSTLSSRVTQVFQYDFHTPSGMNQE